MSSIIKMKSVRFVVLMILSASALGGCAVKHKREADTESVIEAYRAQKESVKNCYYIALEKNPSLQGELTLAWVVDGKGTLKKSWIKDSSLGNADMETCILDHLKTVTFPRTQSLAQITVEYTLTFQR